MSVADVGPTQTEVMTAVGIARSTVADILGDLLNLGYVSSLRGCYQPGPALLGLAATIGQQSDLATRLHPLLEEVAAVTGETTLLSVVRDRGVKRPAELSILDWVESGHSLRFVPNAGTRPLYPSAAGKVFLAAASRTPAESPPKWLGRVVTKTRLDANTIRRELARVRELGYALNHGVTIPGVTAIAAPVLDVVGNVAAAVTVAGPSSRLVTPETQVWPVLREQLATLNDRTRLLSLHERLSTQ